MDLIHNLVEIKTADERKITFNLKDLQFIEELNDGRASIKIKCRDTTFQTFETYEEVSSHLIYSGVELFYVSREPPPCHCEECEPPDDPDEEIIN